MIEQKTIIETLLFLLDQVERIHAESEMAMNNASVTRTALVAAVQKQFPALAPQFEDSLRNFQGVSGKHSVDPKLDEMRRQLSELPPV